MFDSSPNGVQRTPFDEAWTSVKARGILNHECIIALAISGGCEHAETAEALPGGLPLGCTDVQGQSE